MISSLNNEGVMGVVVPHGVLFRGGAEGEIRKGILESDLVEAVIGLPSALFYGTGIPAALLVTAYYLYWTQKHKYEVRNLIKQMQKELNKDEDYRQIIIKSYHQLLNILDRYGFIKTKTQTVREFTDVMRTALPIPNQSVKLLTSLFEIARYSGIKPKVVDEFGMEMIDGSYNIWCVEAINNLHEVEIELNKGLKEGKVSRFTNIFGMRSAK